MNSIILTGPSAAGKSSVGRKLSKDLGFEFIDTDDSFSEYLGESIFSLFLKLGSQSLSRQYEHFIISQRILMQRRAIIALGASLPRGWRFRENLISCDAKAFVILANPETIVARLKRAQAEDGHASHPLLAHPDPVWAIRSIYGYRLPFYCISKNEIWTDDLDIEGVSTAIQNELRG